jgi:gas vesicle protein GvpA/GvpJ/GvpM family
MTTGNVIQPGAEAAQLYGASGSGNAPGNLGDILERVLDKGLVIAGDIQVNLLDIELLTIKLRLVIASLHTAREVGINWWESDPWLSADAARHADAREADARELEQENRKLRSRISELESGEISELESGEQNGPRARSRSRRAES